MSSIVDDWHDRHGHGAEGSAPAPLASAGAQNSPPAAPSEGPQATISAPAGGETRQTAQYIGNLTNVTEYGTKTGTVHWLGNDNDYYRFTLSSRRTIRLELRNLSADADLYLESESGIRIRSSVNFSTRDDSIVHRLGAGTYYIRIEAFISADDIEYQLRYRRDAEQGESRATAFYIGNLAGADTFRTRSGTVNGADVYRKFTLTRWRTMRIELRELSGNANLYLENASGSALESSRRSGTAAESIVRELAPGTYYIRIDPVSSGDIGYELRYRWDPRPRGWTHQTAWYIGNLTNVISYRAKAGTVNKRFDASDYRRFRMTATGTMRFVLSDLSGNADLYLEDENGNELRRSRRSGTGSETFSRELAAGTYYVRVNAIDDGKIRYQLRYRRDPQRGESYETAINLGNVAGATELRVRPGTVAYRAIRSFTLSAPRTMLFKLVGLQANASLYLENQSRRVIRSSRRPGTADESIVHDLDRGQYFIRIDTRASTSYQLQYQVVKRGEVRDAPYELGNLTNLGMPGSRSGDVNGVNNTDDYYRFTLTHKRTMFFQVSNLIHDVDLYLEDESGTQLARSTNSGTNVDSIERELVAGTYFVRVNAESDLPSTYLLTHQTRGLTRDTAYVIGTFSSYYTRYRADTVSREEGNPTDYHRLSFTSRYAYTFSLTLTNLTGNVDLFLEDANGRLLASSRNAGATGESISRELRPNTTYYIRAQVQQSGLVGYRLNWRYTDSRYVGSSSGSTAAASSASTALVWNDNPVSAPPASSLDERRTLASGGGMLAV